MRTITAAFFNANNNGINSSSMVREQRNRTRRYWIDNQTSGNINKNATMARIECERDICEEELCRLRSALEDLLASMGSRDFENRRRQTFHKPRSMVAKMANLIGMSIICVLAHCHPLNIWKDVMLVIHVMINQNNEWPVIISLHQNLKSLSPITTVGEKKNPIHNRAIWAIRSSLWHIRFSAFNVSACYSNCKQT